MEFKISKNYIWHDDKLDVFVCHNNFNNKFYVSYDECFWVGGDSIELAKRSCENFLKIKANNPFLFKGYYTLYTKEEKDNKILFVTNYEEL